MTIVELEVLLHYGYCPGDYPFVSLTHGDARRKLERLGLLASTHCPCPSAQLKLTERGQAYIDALKALPLPELRWVMP